MPCHYPGVEGVDDDALAAACSRLESTVQQRATLVDAVKAPLTGADGLGVGGVEGRREGDFNARVVASVWGCGGGVCS